MHLCLLDEANSDPSSEQLSGSVTRQTTMMDCVKGIDLSTQGLGEKFLDYIKDSTKWKDDLIRAIH